MIVAVARDPGHAWRRRRLTVAGHDVDVAIGPVDRHDGPESAAARALAEDLAAAALQQDRRDLRIASLAPSGRPVLLVAGRAGRAAVSLSHVEGLVAAAVGSTTGVGVGVDIVDPAEAGRGLDFWFTPDELALEPDEGLLRARLWAAKEAAYKAAGLDEELRPRTVAIESLGSHGFTWTARSGFTRAVGAGRLLTVGRHVVAVAVSTDLAATPQDNQTPATVGAAIIQSLETVLA
ncbi:MAG: 4'-phosphopantetheinyl transferase superfamily protein [Planctomycetota bacterium]